ncbi:TPR domain-containing protein [Rutstroemia sp. NJR-2017a BBW]|nr:TPR domain-containing protein [Rutstroemia sp. NJR-2017a BBW]
MASLLNNLNRAIEVTEIAVGITQHNHPDRAARLNNLGNHLGERFDRTGSMDDLNRAIDTIDVAVKSTLHNHPDRAAYLNNLAGSLGTRFKRTGSMDDLNRAVDTIDIAVKSTPHDHPSRATYLDKLGNRLGERFDRTGSMDDLNRAIDVADMAVKSTPHDHPDRAGRLNNLAISLGTRFDRTGSMNDLNRAIDIADMAVKSTPHDHPARAMRLNNLGNRLGTRFDRTDSMDDLNRAVDTIDVAVKSTLHDHPDRAAYLSNLGASLGKRFDRTGSMDDLNRAVDAIDIAVKSTLHDHPNRAAYLNNLAALLGTRFGRTGSMDDLNRAIDVADIAVKSTPHDHPKRATYLDNLGNRLGERFSRTGSMDDLNRAIDVADMAVKSTPHNHPDRATYLNNLGSRLDKRFDRTGSMDDLNRAIDVADMAVKSTLHNHPARAARLNNLAASLGTRFGRTGSMDDLNRAIDIADMAVTGSMDDLNRAVDTIDVAVKSTLHDHPDRAAYLNNLGASLGKRFGRTGSMDDLNRAIDTIDIAVKSTPHDHPSRATYLDKLGNRLGERFERTDSMGDLQRCISSFRAGWNCSNAPPSVRIKLARVVAKISALDFNWTESSTLLKDAVELLPTVSPRSLQHTDKQHMLADFAGLASIAVSIALNAGQEAGFALKLLELGRGVIAGLLLEIRTDISDLEQQYPKLAQEFVHLRDELDSPAGVTTSLTTLENTFSVESITKRRHDAERRFPVVLEEIRSKQGFNTFLLPPTPDELKAAADPDPIVVINVSSYRCDAFLVQQNYPIQVLELPNLHLKDIEEKAESLRTSDPYQAQKILEWLWDVVASPILDVLGFNQPPSDNNYPHIWWIPTGKLSQLPLHAAGRHYKNSTDTVLDRVMSSYSSSIKALIYGRRHRLNNPAQCAPDNALLITVPGANLPFALDEVKMLEELCPSLKLNPVKPTPGRDEILQHLRTCKIFHFASHGQSNPLEPSESCLVLEGENNSITVADLRDCKLQENSPFLAYLSACSTKANKAERLVDEEIHLVSACQLAGFRHVVGTLWEVSDEYCVGVARILYETIKNEGMTDRAVYKGLHRAIIALRDKDIAITETEESDIADGGSIPRQSSWDVSGSSSHIGGPLRWAAYIHAGL